MNVSIPLRFKFLIFIDPPKVPYFLLELLNLSSLRLFFLIILQTCLDRSGLPFTEMYPISVSLLDISPVLKHRSVRSKIKDKRCLIMSLYDVV